MDELDVKILRLLWEDGRMPVHAIAKELGISGSAVNKRIRGMMSRGELLGFTVLLNSDKILNSAVISLRARRKRDVIFESVNKIKGLMHFVGCLGGRYYGEFWYADDMELEEKVLLFKELTHSYSVEVYKHGGNGNYNFEKVDWRILLAMRDDARIPFAKLSKIVGLSAKTISKRWDRLREDDVVKAYPVINRPFTKDIFWFSLFMKVDSLSVENKIKKIPNLWRTSTFKDPLMVYGVFYARFVREIDETMERLVCMKGVKNVHYEMIVQERFYPQYLDYVAYKMGYNKK